ncbi:hypothetical protein FDP41_010699 [Naegleria fowleri]|uniref:Uncharacterized protein n=1 Tax=Naegleria fowleri TaxID=5763 RepID=A0A6A5CAQ5_NAEFO|nr:uncharacterized protein FDP41_010699 [Naegleria fowleri]KAF0983634.1 hypothetical protein FDP41_010699 [Naegleria fowleri]
MHNTETSSNPEGGMHSSFSEQPHNDDGYDEVDTIGKGIISPKIVYHPYFQIAALCFVLGLILSVTTPIAGYYILDGIYLSMNGPSHLFSVSVLTTVGLFLSGLALIVVAFVMSVLSTQWQYITIESHKERFGAGDLYGDQQTNEAEESKYASRVLLATKRTFIISCVFTVPFTLVGLYLVSCGIYAVSTTPSSAYPAFTNVVDMVGFALGFLMLHCGCAIIAIGGIISISLYRKWKKVQDPSSSGSSPHMVSLKRNIKKYLCCIEGQVVADEE